MNKMIIGAVRRNQVYTPAQVEALSAKAQSEVSSQNKERNRKRREVEDRLLAKSLGLTLEELQTPH
jgi:hypothetical protein